MWIRRPSRANMNEWNGLVTDACMSYAADQHGLHTTADSMDNERSRDLGFPFSTREAQVAA